MSSPNSSSTTVTLGGGSPDELGGAASDLVGLHGNRVIQAGAIATVVSATSTVTVVGNNNTDIQNLIVAVNAIVVALKAKGITA